MNSLTGEEQRAISAFLMVSKMLDSSNIRRFAPNSKIEIAGTVCRATAVRLPNNRRNRGIVTAFLFIIDMLAKC